MSCRRPCRRSGRTWPPPAVEAPVSATTAPRGRRLLRQPDAVELLVEVVRGRDRPAPHLCAVGDDAVPLQRVDVVHLLVLQSLLERPEIALALLGVDRAGLPDVQVVEDGVLVTAVVVVGETG